MLAAIPALSVCEEDEIERFFQGNDREHEAQLGLQMASAAGPRFQQLVVWGRWMLIPFSILGACYCRKWATLLFGPESGILALWLWCFEPNILGHAQLITNDIPATSLGLVSSYYFFLACKDPCKTNVFLSGVTLGIALLTKFTWIVLPPLWAVLWLVAYSIKLGKDQKLGRSMLLLGCMLSIGLLVLNAGFFFQGLFLPVDQFKFKSHLLSRIDLILNTLCLNQFPVPLPADYLRGIDSQWSDLESPHWRCYLGGEWKFGGWWYYYVYASGCKLAVGTILLIGFAVVSNSLKWFRDASVPFPFFCLFVPSVLVWILASSHSSLNQNFRYVIPGLAPLFVLVGSCAKYEALKFRTPIATLSVWLAVSSLLSAPYSLSYFNELVGGTRNGHRFLLHSNLDWGQDLVSLRIWLDKHPDIPKVYVAYFGYIDPIDYGLKVEIAPDGPIKNHPPTIRGWQPGWYVVSKNYVYGCTWGISPSSRLSRFRYLKPVDTCGGSMLVYRVEQEDLQLFQEEFSE